MALDKKLIDPLLAELKTRLEAGKDDDEKKEIRATFFDELKDAAPDVYNTVHTIGFSAGQQRGGKAGEKATATAKQLEADLVAARAELEELKTKTPDLGAFEKKYQDRIAKIERERDTERSEREATDRRRLLSDARKDIEAKLVAEGMRQKVARGEVARLVEEGFIALADDGKSVEYRRLDDKDSLYPAPRGDAPAFDGLVKAAIKSADPADLSSAVDRGGNAGRNGLPVQRQTNGNGMTRVVTRDELGAEGHIDLTPQFIDDKRAQVARGM
jgi:hypothetical protein